MSKKNKILIGVLVAILLAAAAAYGAVAYYYSSHFYSDTRINNIDCTGMTVDEVITRINENLDQYELFIKERGDKEEVIRGNDLDISFTDNGDVARMMEAQDPNLWILDFFEKKNHEIQVTVAFAEEKLTGLVDALQCMQAENITQPKDAYVTATDTGFIVAAEDPGNQPVRDLVIQVIRESVLAGETEVNLDERDCYVKPVILQDDPTLNSEADAINKVVSANITIPFGDAGSENLNPAILKDWIIYDEAGKPAMDQGKIKAYVQSLADKYDTVGKDRGFTTTTGQNITVSGGDFGWAIDVDTTTDNLIAAINGGLQGGFELAYSSTAKSRNANDIGNSYVELSIQDQTFWVYVDGQMVLSTPVVTGTVSLGRDTPTGIYKIKGKTTDYIMKGDKNSDGEWSYQVHCDYWIPFAANGTIGFHDLASRSEYGGEIYKTAGSHGCVNTPLDKVSQLYEIVSYNFPVVVY